MNKGFVFLDIVTTGYSPILNKIVYIDITQFDLDMKPKKSYNTWINPEEKVSSAFEKAFNITNKELSEYPTFDAVYDIIYSLIKDRTLGTHESKIDVVEFLKEELFNVGIEFKYKKKDLVFTKIIEDTLFERNVDNLYYKYEGTHNNKATNSKKIGEIFKHQCNFLNVDYKDFNYSKNMSNKELEYADKYLYEASGKLYLNFGKFKDTDIEEVKKDYIEWILESDFPTEVKNKIKDYLKI